MKILEEKILYNCKIKRFEGYYRITHNITGEELFSRTYTSAERIADLMDFVHSVTKLVIDDDKYHLEEM